MKIVFMGTPQAAVPSLQRIIDDGHEVAAVYIQPDRPSGRGNKITFSPVKEFALANDLAIYQPTKIKTPEALASFKSPDADVAVVVAYGRILPETFLTAFPNGAVNLHFSLLPKYRGAAPVNWAIVNGEKETGVTTMRMDAGLDTGPILEQRAISIAAGETAIELMMRLSVTGADLLSETLAMLADIEPKPQDHDRATLAPIMKREDGLIDWRMSAEEISNRVRGFQPFPTAFTYFDKMRLALWRAAPVTNTSSVDLIPGQIVDAHGDEFSVACGGSTILKIEEVQPEGKRRMWVRDFSKRLQTAEGNCFGGRRSGMDEVKQIQIISFYEFKRLAAVGQLLAIKASIKEAMIAFGVRGTIIVADEGFNGMVCGAPDQIAAFTDRIEEILQTKLAVKTSVHEKAPFRKIDVKIKPEIVTLKQPVDISLGKGTHVKPSEWNNIISDPGTLLLDARNDYEYKSGTFRGAINPDIKRFSDLPEFVAGNLDPDKHKRVAMFCTGGIRCEKFAPYMKQMGFDEVYQLEGGILKYLEETPVDETLWQGECFVFDERITVDAALQKGTGPDHSQRHSKRKKPKYKVTE